MHVFVYLIGLIFVAGGVVSFRSARRRERQGLRAPAQVVGREWTGQGDDRASFPVVAFQTAGGELVRTRTRTGGFLARSRVGRYVRVIYDPADPRDVVIDTLIGRGTLGSALSVLAGLCLLGLHASQVIR